MMDVTAADGEKKAVLLCECCNFNSVVKLTNWTRGLSERFPGVDFGYDGVVALVISLCGCDRGADGGDGENVTVQKFLSRLEFHDRFGGVLRVCSDHFGVRVECPFETRFDQPLVKGGDGYLIYDDVVHGYPGSCDRCRVGRVPVFSGSQLESMVTIGEVLGRLNEEGFVLFTPRREKGESDGDGISEGDGSDSDDSSGGEDAVG